MLGLDVDGSNVVCMGVYEDGESDLLCFVIVALSMEKGLLVLDVEGTSSVRTDGCLVSMDKFVLNVMGSRVVRVGGLWLSHKPAKTKLYRLVHSSAVSRIHTTLNSHSLALVIKNILESHVSSCLGGNTIGLGDMLWVGVPLRACVREWDPDIRDDVAAAGLEGVWCGGCLWSLAEREGSSSIGVGGAAEIWRCVSM